MAKYMLIMRGTDESMAKLMDTPMEEMLARTLWASSRDRRLPCRCTLL
jgi:hypothetical protein